MRVEGGGLKVEDACLQETTLMGVGFRVEGLEFRVEDACLQETTSIAPSAAEADSSGQARANEGEPETTLFMPLAPRARTQPSSPSVSRLGFRV